MCVPSIALKEELHIDIGIFNDVELVLTLILNQMSVGDDVKWRY